MDNKVAARTKRAHGVQKTLSASILQLPTSVGITVWEGKLDHQQKAHNGLFLQTCPAFQTCFSSSVF